MQEALITAFLVCDCAGQRKHDRQSCIAPTSEMQRKTRKIKPFD